MFQSQSSIKRSALKYIKCPKGGLHEGQLMNLVCVDAKSSKRGLICPICQMQNHENQEVLPVKTFLEQIRSMFLQENAGGNEEEINSLSDYLRALQKTKKNILSILKGEVEKLSKSFKCLEQKIQESYISIRKNVLIQASLTTKLPTLLTLLTEENASKDSSETIQEHFRKYTELLKYEDEKLKVSDNAKVLVKSYTMIPDKFRASLEKCSSEYSSHLEEKLPKLLDLSAKNGKANNQNGNGNSSEAVVDFSFSEENKFFDIFIAENGKLAKASEYMEELGYVLVKEGKGEKNQKITVLVEQNTSGSMVVGFGDAQEFINTGTFINDGILEGTQKEQSFDFLYCTGDIRILSSDMNATGICNVTFEAGHKVSIEYNGEEVIYENLTLKTKYAAKPIFSEEAKKNLQFVFSMGENDQLRIIDNE